MRFWPGLRPGPHWGSSNDASPDPLIGWEGDTAPQTPVIGLISVLAICLYGPNLYSWIRPCSQSVGEEDTSPNAPPPYRRLDALRASSPPWKPGAPR